MRLEVPDRAAHLPESDELAFELLIESEGLSCRRRVTVKLGRGLHRCRSGLRHDDERKQANE